MFLIGEVGTTLAAKEEWVMEKYCEKLSWEEVIEVVWARKREIESLGEALGASEMLQDPILPEEGRSFLGAVLEGYPDLDIRLLAARRRESSEEGRKARMIARFCRAPSSIGRPSP
jgi:hypothetical protein